MWLNQRSFIGAVTALSLLSSANGRAISRRDDFCPESDLVNDNGDHWDGSPSQLFESTFHLAEQQAEQQKVSPKWLRILPLGASITRGLKSTPEDGYRKSLREHLKSLGHNVNMVGSHVNKDGSMQDGEHEGVAGARIDQVYHNMDASSTTKPNIYLINAGTNDCQQNYKKMEGTIDRLNDLLTKAWDKSKKSTIILSTLTPSYNGEGPNKRVNDLNKKIRDLVKKLKDQKRRIVLAEMNDGFLSKKDMNADGIHPTNDGYKKMAAVWTTAILKARQEKLLQEPENTGKSDDMVTTSES
ncbi:SGNH hydrolase [Ophiobolus disseminans]|uniref:SGNH hydrolase n=1 Tax=Ophiobolus disseminans TaxID=1469910 RepID=A0A6A6ZSJ9_9PLEO|nr:SGNH hydrolase [Ophiobolus disseminans]